jgi:2-phosphosulfolactate phosphatase
MEDSVPMEPEQLVGGDAVFDQSPDAYRFEWGEDGLRSLAPTAAVVVIVDVLSFTTAVDVAVGRGAAVIPYPVHDASAAEHAARRGAVLAGRVRRPTAEQPFTLSPSSLDAVPSGLRLLIPSVNGSALACIAQELGAPVVLAGSLRNASAVAVRAREAAAGGGVAVIAAGERWDVTSSGTGVRPPVLRLRPAVEDLLGAGAVLAALDPAGAASPPRCSPEAAAARAAFLAARPRLHDTLAASTSGRQLVEAGCAADVALAAAWDTSAVASELVDGVFTSPLRLGDG